MIYFTKLGKLGRLGNQMFQYATLVAVAKTLNYKFQIDLTATELSNAFHLSAIDKQQVPKPIFFFQEKPQTFDENLFFIEDNTDISGFFQSFKYFENCEKKIRNEFKFHSDIELIAKKRIEEFRGGGGELVSVHVRRGDYVTRDNNIFTQDAIKICKVNYYLKAMSLFRNEMVKFVVFSDDISWCKQNIKIDALGKNSIVYIEGNNQYTDLCMMTLCDHNIISASTFGWWGAWLNSNPLKKIIVPRRWFGFAWGNNTNNLYLDNWIIVGTTSEHIKYWITELLSFFRIRKIIYEIIVRMKYVLFYPKSVYNSLIQKTINCIKLVFKK